MGGGGSRGRKYSGGARNFFLVRPKIQGVLVGRGTLHHHPDKVTESTRLPQVPQVARRPCGSTQRIF